MKYIILTIICEIIILYLAFYYQIDPHYFVLMLFASFMITFALISDVLISKMGVQKNDR